MTRFRICLIYLISLVGLLPGNQVQAQGPAVILPISKAVTDPSEAVSFHIHNQQDEALTLKFDPKCDLAGQEFIDEPCLQAFDLSFDIALKDGAITIPKGGKVAGMVKLKRKDLPFALFKPLFSPISGAEQKANKVTFEMKYQPGYLFLVNPLKEQIAGLDYQMVTTDQSRRMRFQLDISKLSAPQVLGVTVKVIDIKSRKMVRLLRLASEKIADPKRRVLDVEADFADKSDKTDVCYEMYIANVSAKDIYKRTNCP